MNTDKCSACGNNRWWCCGCGYRLKIDGLMKSGLSEERSKEICDEQFGPCDTFVPCFVCNFDGKTGEELGPRNFWKET